MPDNPPNCTTEDGLRRDRLFACAVAGILAIVLATAPMVTAQTSPPAAGDAGSAQRLPIEALFNDFLHYSVLGRFQLAETFALELLDHPDLDPVELLKLAERNARSMDTLLVIINNSTIARTAARVLEIIHQGEHLQRKDADRIKADIDQLGGPPQTEYNATQRLIDSGEYAIPWMIQTLRDPARQALWSRVIRALPTIGKSALNPLTEALAFDSESIGQTIVFTLGELGYAQAVPYLQAIQSDPNVSPERKAAAVTAIARIQQRGGVRIDADAADGFVRLAEQFYDEHGSVRADPRLGQANVWYWNPTNQFLDAVPVPTRIFGAVMAMRCCERALQLRPRHAGAIALWLAANIRREARLGLDVESGDASEPGETDATRPPDFPRALYFTTAAGPRYAHLALQRALDDSDAAVALGAIAGLQRVAGSSSLIGPDDYDSERISGFAEALKFPDLVVRIRAALALGNALPRSGFRGSELVVPRLANALLQTGRRNILVIDRDADRRSRVMNALRDADTNVIGAADIGPGIERAEHELPWLSTIFLSAQAEPTLAVRTIRERYEYETTPIVLLVQRDQALAVERILEADTGVAAVDTHASAELLADAIADVSARVGQTPLGPDRALAIALQAAATLQRIAIDGRTVFDPARAQAALIDSLASTSQDLQIAAIGVLSLLPRGAAQRAIAGVALDGHQPESLRLAAFEGLSESAKRFANQLPGDQTDQLLRIAMDEPNLRLRTAASHALGALNLAADKANQTILKFHRG